MTGEELKKILIKYGLNNSQFAELVGLDKSTIGKYLKGDLSISDSRAKLFNLALEDLTMCPGESPTTLPNRSFAGDIDLRRFRKGMNLGQGDLAEALGKSQSWISQVENDQARLTDDQERQLLAKWPEAELYRKYALQGHHTKDDVEIWRKRVEDLEARIKDKEEIINLLKQNNTLLKERAEFPEENDHDNHKAG